MSNGEFLTTGDPELEAFTDYARAKEQAIWLKERNIPHRLEEKRVIVSRVHLRQWLEGRELVVGDGVNWAALNA
jgi:hypothetical protein